MLSKSLCLIRNNAVAHCKSTTLFNFLAYRDTLNYIPRLDTVRYAARKGTRAALLAAKKAKKLEMAGKPAPVPKYLQRKVKVSQEAERCRCTDENWLDTKPIDDVWNIRLYRGKTYSVAEAVAMHLETHQPAMLNDPTAFLYANIEVDLKTKKKDRFMDDFTGILTYPHRFETLKKNRVVVVCKEAADQDKAMEAGAAYAGSTVLIKQILSGSIASENFDYVVCHPDSYKDLSSLRGILKKRYPNAYNGLLRLDLDKGVISFTNGIEYSSKRSVVEPDFGWVDVCFGRLNMPINELEENLKYALNSIEKLKPNGTDHIAFIIRTMLSCEKSREKFKIPHWELLPNYPENAIFVEKEEQDEKVDATVVKSDNTQEA